MEQRIRRIKGLFLLLALLCSVTCLKGEDYERAHSFVKSDDINGALAEYNNLVNIAMDERKQTRGVDPVLMAEYGYTLALARIYDVALITLDEAYSNAQLIPRKNVSKEVRFYIHETLLLMGYDSLAMPFQKDAAPPRWLSEQEIRTLREKHASAPIINREDFKTTYARVRKLTEEKSLLQALVLSEELTFFYEQQPFSAMAMGKVWDRLGFYEESLQCYQKSLDKTSASDTSLRSSVEQQIQHARKKMNDPFTKFKLKYNPRMMMYLGGTFSLSSAAVSARVGFYTNSQFNVSLNFSYSHLYDEYTDSFFIGLTAYKRFFNILAVGLSLNQQFGNGDYELYVAPSVGVSLYLPNKKMSLDLFYNLNIPCLDDSELQHNISFGVTTYF